MVKGMRVSSGCCIGMRHWNVVTGMMVKSECRDRNVSGQNVVTGMLVQLECCNRNVSYVRML